MNYSVSLQWTLDQTADCALRVGRDLIVASTRDNVQPIALLACEKFGATIAICSATRSKVERLIRSQTGHVVIRFLQAKAGFAGDGSIVQLSRTLAGVNFLALATALVSTTDTFMAGTALESMIVASATDKALVPTAHHLMDLLNVLEPRLSRAGFMTEVLNWKEWWMKAAEVADSEQYHILRHGETFPGADGLAKIVEALRDAYRIGEATKVTFTARAAVPWLSAFITWCTGVCPIIYSHNGQVLLRQSDTLFNIIYSEKRSFDNEIEIEIVRTSETFTGLIAVSLESPSAKYSHLSAGMTNIQTYAKHALASLDLNSDLGKRALAQALPHALHEVRRLIPWEKKYANYSDSVDEEVVSIKAGATNPLPQESIIADTMAIYLSLEEGCSLKRLATGTLISDLPVVRLWLNEQSGYSVELDFASQVSLIAADILALSLFHGCQDSLLVYYSSSWHAAWQRATRSNFSDKIKQILVGKRSGPYVDGILQWALKLLGHDKSRDMPNKGEARWLGSSFKGQVIFPKVFEDQILRQNGYIELFSIPGVLTMAGNDYRTFSLVKGHETSSVGAEQATTSVPVSVPLSLYPSERVLWNIQAMSDHILVSMGWSRNLQRVNPDGLLHYLQNAVFNDSCPHMLDTALNRSVVDCQFALPGSDLPRLDRATALEDAGIKNFPTMGNDGLRMLALSAFSAWDEISDPNILINRGACINCLLDACQHAECYYIIL